MRNLKRALSLTLASVMLLGMMVVGASAAGFPDVEDTHNVEAIEVLKAVDVMVGDDKGNFGPDQQVSRAQMAVVMAKLLNLDYNYYQGQCKFTDVPNWAAPYVAACYANGIVSGYNDTTYGANDDVTAVQAASMMMRALGYFKYKEDYQPTFELATVKQASEIGIFSQVKADAKTPLTRNQVAQMALNALESEMVTFTGVPGIEANGITVGYRAEYTPRTSTEIKYQAIEQRTSDVSGGNNLNRGQYYIQLGEQLYDGKLTKRYARDDFERPSINWQYNGKDVGTYVDYELLVVNGTYTDKVTGEALYDLLTYTTIDQNDLLVYTDGVANNTQKTELRRSNKNAVGGSGKGVLTEVFLDEERDEIIVTSINTYLAKANSDYNTTNETLSLRVYTGSSSAGVTTTTKIVDSDEVPQAEGVAKDDFKLVYMSGKESATTIGNYVNYDVVKIFDTEIMSAAEITKFSTNDTKVVGKLTTGGTEYDTNVKAFYDFGEVLDQYDNQLLSDTTYNIYLDRYGNVIGVDLNEGNLNYVFITGYDRGRSNISVKTADAAAIFTDGTMDTIVVNVTDTNKNIRGAKASAKDPYAYMEYGEWNVQGNNALTGGDRNLNRWYTYTQSANGNYTLKPVKNFMFTSYNIAANGSKVLDSANLYLDDSSVINGTVTPTANKGRVYGEDESIYITVGEGLVDTGNGTDAITDVDGVYTGAQDIKIELTAGSKGTVNNDKTAANKAENAQESLAEQSAYVYTVFDNNNYIIASVVMGEAQGASANYVYVMGGAKNERVEKGSASRAANGDTYYWEFDAVVDGVETTLTVREKYSTTLQNNLNVHGLVELRFDGDYVVDIDPVDDEDIFYYYGPNNIKSGEIEDKNVYDVGNVIGTKWVDNNTGEVHFTNGLKDEEKIFADHYNEIERVEGTIYLQGNTLYVDNAAGQRDVGLALARNTAKAVLVQPENGEIESTSCGTVQEAIDRLADRDPSTANPGTQFKGRIVAVLDNRGVAQWVVIISDTNLVTGNDPTYGNYSGNVSIAANDTGKLAVLNGSKISVNGVSTYLTLNLDAPDWADAVNVSANDLTMRATLMMDGNVYDSATLALGNNLTSTTKDGKTTYSAALVDLFPNTAFKLALGQVDASKHNFSVVLSNISYAKVNVRYIYADNNAVPAAALTDEISTLTTVGTGAGVKVHYTASGDPAYELKAGAKLTYSITGATRVSGAALSGDLTDNTAVEPTAYANGNGWVTVTIGGMTKKATTPVVPGTAYTVKANSALTGKVKFAVVDSAPANQAGIDAIAASEWKDSVSDVNGKIVLIKSATSGVKLTAVTAMETETGTNVSSSFSAISTTGVYKYTVASKDVTVTAVTTDKVSVTKGSIKSDASVVNLLTDKPATGLTQAEKYQLAIDYVNTKTSYTAEADTDLNGNITGMKINGKTVSTLNINNNLAVVKVNGANNEVVTNNVAGTATLGNALEMAGITVTGRSGDTATKLYVLLTRSGDSTTTNNGTWAIINDTTGFATTLNDGDVIDTNGVNGYAKVTMGNVDVTTDAANTSLAGTVTPTIATADKTAIAGTAVGTASAGEVVKVGSTFTVTATGFTAVAQNAANKGGQLAAGASQTGVSAVTLTEVDKIEAGAAIETTDELHATIALGDIIGDVTVNLKATAPTA